jgi:hypothetical protein
LDLLAPASAAPVWAATDQPERPATSPAACNLIAHPGALVAVVKSIGDWQTAWWSSAALTALAAAVLFGGTFIGITTLSLAAGRHLRVPRAIAILAAGYGIGQVLGPLVVEPTLHGGYLQALLVGAGLVLAAGVGSALLRVKFPHQGEAHHGNRSTRPAGAREMTVVPERAV